MDICPICKTQTDKDYCPTCGWKILIYLENELPEDEEKYNSRLYICRHIYNVHNNYIKTKKHNFVEEKSNLAIECPICKKLAINYCKECGWEILDYIESMSKESKEIYNNRFNLWLNIYSNYKSKIENKEEPNLTKEIKNLIELCNKGNFSSCNSLGYMYDKGLGVEQDYKKALELYQKACEGGDMIGCKNLGYMYDEGLGVKQDYKKAVELYQKACEGGNMFGCYNLGNMYKNGLGVKQDYKKAVELYQKACDGGDSDGCKKVEELKELI